jgi:DNA-binding LacI/PurR family transcriptional regulator
MTRNVTHQDIADRVGVSRATVSLVLNGQSTKRVTPALAEKIRAEAQAMAYVTNRLARTLRTGESNVLALVVPKVDNPFFGEVYLGAESAANAAGYTLSLVHSRNTQTTQEVVVQHLAERAVDGFVLWQPMNPSITKRYANRIVTVEHRIPGVSSVEFAVNQAMHTLLSHATKRYQSIIHLTVDLPDATFVMRREAFVTFGQKHPSVQMRQIRVPFDFLQIVHILGPIFDAQRDQTTLYCCDDDTLAAAVYHVAYKHTRTIPQQVAVMSIGGASVAELLFPTLTHIKLPAFELGSHAIRFLVSTLQGHASQSIVLPGAFVQGKST